MPVFFISGVHMSFAAAGILKEAQYPVKALQEVWHVLYPINAFKKDSKKKKEIYS
jgi:hypothetical protein